MKINTDLVTICIPSYNHALFLNYCLDSILQESYSNLEIDIIDDGSTDASVEIVRNWQRNNPKIRLRLEVQKNKGLNYTLNKLVSNANGVYICFLSSDDALFSNSISKRVEILKKHPNKLVVIGDSKVINSNNKVVYQSAIEDLYKGKKSNYMTDEKLKFSVINEFSIPGSNLLVKKHIYEIIGPYPQIFAEDINFYLKVIGLDLLIFLNEPVNYYRVHENNTAGNLKNKIQLNKTFIYSYLNNIRHFEWKYKMILIRKTIGRIIQLFKYHLK